VGAGTARLGYGQEGVGSCAGGSTALIGVYWTLGKNRRFSCSGKCLRFAVAGTRVRQGGALGYGRGAGLGGEQNSGREAVCTLRITHIVGLW